MLSEATKVRSDSSCEFRCEGRTAKLHQPDRYKPDQRLERPSNSHKSGKFRRRPNTTDQQDCERIKAFGNVKSDDATERRTANDCRSV